MIFLGTTFFSGKHTLSPPPSKVEKANSIGLSDGSYEHLFLSKDPSKTVNDLGTKWTYDTIINASYETDLNAGNSTFSLNTTNMIAIKRRELGTQKWTVIYVKEIKTVDDLQINITDYYARSGVKYEYCLSSYMNEIENAYITQEVKSEFDGFYIADKDGIYGTIYDVDGCDTTRNTISQTLNLLNSKYVNVVSNSMANYDSGNITGTFINLDEKEEYDEELSRNYRELFKDKLTNKKPLILKVHDGRIWMIKAITPPTDSQGLHPDMRQISFGWVEVGGYDDMKALYYSGLSDVDSRWW